MQSMLPPFAPIASEGAMFVATTASIRTLLFSFSGLMYPAGRVERTKASGRVAWDLCRPPSHAKDAPLLIDADESPRRHGLR